MKAKPFFVTILSLLSFIFVGCSPTLVNLTPERVPQNSSDIYTLSMTPKSLDGSVIKESFQPVIVIDEQTYPMRFSSLGEGIFDYDLRMPEGTNEATYYYILNYATNHRGTAKPRVVQSDVYTLRIANRYVISMESTRGPVGTQIAVMGRGFSQYDQVLVGGKAADTTYNSNNALEFTVPALPAGSAYVVELDNGKNIIPIGNFQIDEASIRVSPGTLVIGAGQKTIMLVGADFQAPSGGLLVDVTTDIPNSVIMPEIIIPEGARNVSIPVEGGQSGRGYIYFNAPGFSEIAVPVSVVE